MLTSRSREAREGSPRRITGHACGVYRYCAHNVTSRGVRAITVACYLTRRKPWRCNGISRADIAVGVARGRLTRSMEINTWRVRRVRTLRPQDAPRADRKCTAAEDADERRSICAHPRHLRPSFFLARESSA